MRNCCFIEGMCGFLRDRAWVPVGSHIRTLCFTKATCRFLAEPSLGSCRLWYMRQTLHEVRTISTHFKVAASMLDDCAKCPGPLFDRPPSKVHDNCAEGRPGGLSFTQKGVSKIVFLGGSQLGLALYSGLPNALSSLKRIKVIRFYCLF